MVNDFAGSILVGAATGGSKGAGTINVSSNIYKNNTAYTNPDFVLEHFFTGQIEKYKDNPGAAGYRGLLPLANLRTYLSKNHHLPGRMEGPAGIFDMADMAQQWIEELAIYIVQLHERLERLENGNA